MATVRELVEKIEGMSDEALLSRINSPFAKYDSRGSALQHIVEEHFEGNAEEGIAFLRAQGPEMASDKQIANLELSELAHEPQGQQLLEKYVQRHKGPAAATEEITAAAPSQPAQPASSPPTPKLEGNPNTVAIPTGSVSPPDAQGEPPAPLVRPDSPQGVGFEKTVVKRGSEEEWSEDSVTKAQPETVPQEAASNPAAAPPGPDIFQQTSPENLKLVEDLAANHPELAQNIVDTFRNNPELRQALSTEGGELNNELFGEVLETVQKHPENTQILLDKVNELKETNPDSYQALLSRSGKGALGGAALIQAIKNPGLLDQGVKMMDMGQKLSSSLDGIMERIMDWFENFDWDAIFSKLEGFVDSLTGKVSNFVGGDPGLAQNFASLTGGTVTGAPAATPQQPDLQGPAAATATAQEPGNQAGAEQQPIKPDLQGPAPIS